MVMELSYNGEAMLAYRAVFFYVKGKIPESFYVCHSCDNPACINPDHLHIGTQAMNMREASDRGRCQQKFTLEQIKEIRDLLEHSELLQTDIAGLYGVTPNQIGYIKRGGWRRYLPNNNEIE